MSTHAALNLNLTESERDRIATVESYSAAGEASIGKLVEMLDDPSWVVRREVVTALSRLGEPAVQALCFVLTDRRNNEARLAAAVDSLVLSQFRAEEILFGLASNPEPAVIADMIQVLGRRRHASSVPLLVRLTRHEDDNVAVAAMEALGRIGGRAAVEALLESIGTGNFFRTFPAIDVLGRSGDPRAVEPLSQLLGNPNFLPEAARALGRTGERSAVRPLLRLLNTPSVTVVRLAALALWDLRERYEEKSGGSASAIDQMVREDIGPEATRRLARVLSNADISEGVAICKLLGAIGTAEAADRLTLAVEGPAPIAACAVESLKKIGRDAESNLLRAIREGDSNRRKSLLPIITRTTAAEEVANCLADPDVEVRAIACDTLARIGNSSVVEKIFPLLADKNLRVVHSATAAIQSLGSREARRMAVESTRSENPGVRRGALRILGYFGDSESVQPLLDGLRDPDERVREAALQGLPLLEDPHALEALLNEAKSLSPRTRSLAVRSLGQVPKASERIYAILLKRLTDPDAWVRYYACQSIGRLGFESAIPEVAALLEDEAGQVRVSAVEALSHLNSPDAHVALRRAAAFEDMDVRRAALVGLGIAHRPEDLPLVLEAVSSMDIPTRLIALSALVNFNSPLVLSALSAAGSDPDEQVRSAAIGFLASRPEQEATDVLVELLYSPTTQDRAREALLVPSQSRVPGLLSALRTANEEIAPLLVSTLSRIDRSEARGALLAAMKLENSAARKAAAVVLATRRDSEMRATLVDASENDPDPGVRNICALLLKD